MVFKHMKDAKINYMIILLFLCLSNCQEINDLALGSSESIFQESTWKYFKFTGDFTNSDYISIELHLQSSAEIIFCAKIGSIPTATSSHVNAHYFDYDGWYLSTKNQNLIIPTIEIDDDLFIGIFSNKTNGIHYELNSFSSSTQPCYNGCSAYGHCSDGVCLCVSGYVGRDCIFSATDLSIIEDNRIIINANDVGYAALTLSEFNKKLYMSILSSAYIFLYAKPKTTNDDSALPSPYENRKSKKGLQFDFVISQGHYNTWYFAIYNPCDSAVTIKWSIHASEGGSSSQYLLYILIVISAGILAGWVIFAIYKTRQISKKNAAIGPEPAISIDFINKNFPKVAFKAKKCEEATRSCSICLQLYKKQDMIRELSCAHIFHANCIDTWFQSNTVCCLCKRDYKQNMTMENEESRIEEDLSANATQWIVEELEGPAVTTEIHELTTFRNQQRSDT
ncbi:unnamed protein product [Blepharisma stoltei]|uniref:RING-type domain-containing protein n=1 Tax=Blepharisma stoltei TaxID=1481888 RepID=A0AAU9JLY3_9CILI|nr:unnamed protein product [Blepharisma stoltei]